MLWKTKFKPPLYFDLAIFLEHALNKVMMMMTNMMMILDDDDYDGYDFCCYCDYDYDDKPFVKVWHSPSSNRLESLTPSNVLS